MVHKGSTVLKVSVEVCRNYAILLDHAAAIASPPSPTQASTASLAAAKDIAELGQAFPCTTAVPPRARFHKTPSSFNRPLLPAWRLQKT